MTVHGGEGRRYDMAGEARSHGRGGDCTRRGDDMEGKGCGRGGKVIFGIWEGKGIQMVGDKGRGGENYIQPISHPSSPILNHTHTPDRSPGDVSFLRSCPWDIHRRPSFPHTAPHAPSHAPFLPGIPLPPCPILSCCPSSTNASLFLCFPIPLPTHFPSCLPFS